jgi:hypothetical protein
LYGRLSGLAAGSLAAHALVGAGKAGRAIAPRGADGALRGLWNVCHRKQRPGGRRARFLLAFLPGGTGAAGLTAGQKNRLSEKFLHDSPYILRLSIMRAKKAPCKPRRNSKGYGKSRDLMLLFSAIRQNRIAASRFDALNIKDTQPLEFLRITWEKRDGPD